MKKLLTVMLCLLVVLSVSGCESEPKCEHLNTTTTYELGGFSIKKTITCSDCEKQLSKVSFSKLRFVYDKVLLEDNGIKCTLLNIEIDYIGMITMNFEIEGTGSKKRTFSGEKMYINGYDASIWLYCSDLSENRKSLEDTWISSGLEAEDFLKSQDYQVEFNYSVVNSSNYILFAISL